MGDDLMMWHIIIPVSILMIGSYAAILAMELYREYCNAKEREADRREARERADAEWEDSIRRNPWLRRIYERGTYTEQFYDIAPAQLVQPMHQHYTMDVELSLQDVDEVVELVLLVADDDLVYRVKKDLPRINWKREGF